MMQNMKWCYHHNNAKIEVALLDARLVLRPEAEVAAGTAIVEGEMTGAMDLLLVELVEVEFVVLEEVEDDEDDEAVDDDESDEDAAEVDEEVAAAAEEEEDDVATATTGVVSR